MKKKNKKSVQFLVIIVLLIILSLAYFSFINQKDKKNENTVTVKNSNEKNASPAESIENKDKNTENEQTKNEIPTLVNTVPALAKNEIMDYINNNVEIMAPSAPVSGVWKVNRFWFTNDKNVYVEYSSSGELKQILVAVEGDYNNPIYSRKASFNSGESSWVLEQGQDTEFGKNRELYEKSENQWIKKN